MFEYIAAGGFSAPVMCAIIALGYQRSRPMNSKPVSCQERIRTPTSTRMPRMMMSVGFGGGVSACTGSLAALEGNQPEQERLARLVAREQRQPGQSYPIDFMVDIVLGDV